jgi:protoheme IX farnesyltransferase
MLKVRSQEAAPIKEKDCDLKDTVLEYVQLMKPGIMVLLVLEAITAMVVAAQRHVSLTGLGLLALVGILASGGSGALNQFIERDKDIKMSRTDYRPVATGKITPTNSLAFGLSLAALGLVLAYLAFNLMTMTMVLLGILSYIFLYTLYLKPRTKWNIVIGGVAGVFPALAGWAAVTGFVAWPGLFIGLLVFLWTPPHFWGLSMKFKEDYQRTGMPMLSVLKTESEVIHWIVVSSIPLFALSLLPMALPFLGSFDIIYYVIAVALAAAFIAIDVKMLKHPTAENGFLAFLISLPYMFVLFAAMIVSAVL